MSRLAWGAGVVTSTYGSVVLDAWFPHPTLDCSQSPVNFEIPDGIQRLALTDEDRAVHVNAHVVVSDIDAPPTSTEDVYIRIHLLSHRIVEPNTINLDGIFSLLPNVLWTDSGPIAADEGNHALYRLRLSGRPNTVISLDKFPRMIDYVVPTGVRIANSAMVRLGAYLSPGTTVMHGGFVNYNAGTLGTSMVEGRISQGVVIDNGTDIGGGASTMGTLSGGGRERVRLGKRCLLGANAGLGIALGDDCVVEAGLYVTAGTKVALIGINIDSDGNLNPTDTNPSHVLNNTDSSIYEQVQFVKARELSGKSGILFRRNSITGTVEAVSRKGDGITLNAEIHKN